MSSLHHLPIPDQMKYLASFMYLNLSNKYEDIQYGVTLDYDIAEITHAVFAVAYSLRHAFKERFRRLERAGVAISEEFVSEYILRFSKEIYTNYSPLKIVIISAFISEIVLFFQSSKAKRYWDTYVDKCIEHFFVVYTDVLSNDFHDQSDIETLLDYAGELSSRCCCIQPIISLELPNDTLPFLDAADINEYLNQQRAEAKTEPEKVEQPPHVRRRQRATAMRLGLIDP